jgi:peptidase M76-like protein
LCLISLSSSIGSEYHSEPGLVLRGKVIEPSENTITVYYEDNEGTEDMMITMRHELVHAFDRCIGIYGQNPRHRSIESSACSEIRAAMFSGECFLPTGHGGRLRPGQSPEDCIHKEAAKSIVISWGKSSSEAKIIICCLWDICSRQVNVPGTGVPKLPGGQQPILPLPKPYYCRNLTSNCSDYVNPVEVRRLDRCLK